MKRMASFWLNTAFFYVFLTLTLLSFNPFVYHLPFMRLLVYFTALYGALCCVYRIFTYKRYLKTPYLWLAVLFLISYAATMLLNRRFGLRGSMEGFVWLIFQLLLLFPRDLNEPKAQLAREAHGLFLYFAVYNALAALAGLLMLAFGYGEVYRIGETELAPRGFIWGRLWGAFSDPNYGAGFAATSFALFLYFYARAKTRFKRAACALSMLVLFLYIVFSDSRTGLVALGGSVFLYAFCRAYARRGELWKRRLLALSMGTLALLAAVGGAYGTKLAYNAALNAKPPAGQQGGSAPGLIDRGEGEQSDVSNGRLKLWESGAALFQKAPLLGVGFRNFAAAARELTPEAYFTKNPQGVTFDAFHNVFVDVLAAQGLLGFLAFSVFLLACALKAPRLLRRVQNGRTARLFAVLFAVLGAVLLESQFISDTLYVNTPNAFLLWYMLGCYMRLSAELTGKNDRRARESLDAWEDALPCKAMKKAP